jgi:hypothetical protein
MLLIGVIIIMIGLMKKRQIIITIMKEAIIIGIKIRKVIIIDSIIKRVSRMEVIIIGNSISKRIIVDLIKARNIIITITIIIIEIKGTKTGIIKKEKIRKVISLGAIVMQTMSKIMMNGIILIIITKIKMLLIIGLII